MKEIAADYWLNSGSTEERAAFLACIATILELNPEEVPTPSAGEDAATDRLMARWLGERGMGMVRVHDPKSFAWNGPWIGRRRQAADRGEAVVLYGVPSGPVWNPLEARDQVDQNDLDDGFVIAPLDAVLWTRRAAPPERTSGTVDSIWVAAEAGAAVTSVTAVRAIPGQGLQGDRYPAARGTFPSGPPGSALTLIEAEVCESFSPPLDASEHGRNLVRAAST